MDIINVKVEKSELALKLEKDLELDWSIYQQFPFDAGYDLKACIEKPYTLQPQKRKTIPVGLYFEIEDPYWEIQIRPRSGLSHNYGLMIVNSPGTVDYTYRKEVMVILFNSGEKPFVIEPGDRIAQACFRSVPQVNITYVDVVEPSLIISYDGPNTIKEFVTRNQAQLAKEKQEEEDHRRVSLPRKEKFTEKNIKELVTRRGGFGSTGVK